jgi:hypothetical protein
LGGWMTRGAQGSHRTQREGQGEEATPQQPRIPSSLSPSCAVRLCRSVRLYTAAVPSCVTGRSLAWPRRSLCPCKRGARMCPTATPCSRWPCATRWGATAAPSWWRRWPPRRGTQRKASAPVALHSAWPASQTGGGKAGPGRPANSPARRTTQRVASGGGGGAAGPASAP